MLDEGKTGISETAKEVTKNLQWSGRSTGTWNLEMYKESTNIFHLGSYSFFMYQKRNFVQRMEKKGTTTAKAQQDRFIKTFVRLR